MAILTRDDLVAASKAVLPLYKTAARTTVAGGWFSMFDLAGNPGAGTLAVGNTANGVVRTDAVAGHPVIPFTTLQSYLSRLTVSNTVISQIAVYDRVFSCGAYAFNANTALASQPSYASRVTFDGAANYNGLEIWVEQVTASTGNIAVNVTYTNQAGTTGRTTGATGIGAVATLGRCWQLPLMAGDSGVQAITNVAGTVATAGTFNVHVMRPLMRVYVDVASRTFNFDWADLGLPEIFNDSALSFMVMAPTGTTSGLPWIEAQVANK